MTNYEVQTSVEVPPPNQKGAKAKYPWVDMKPGDSFETPAKDYDKRRLQGVLCAASKSWATRNNIKAKFTTRITDKGVRIWRIE